MSQKFEKNSREEAKNKELFQCWNLIDAYKCRKCPKFQSGCLTYLRKHLNDGHEERGLTENLYNCRTCVFITYSKYLLIRHQMFVNCEAKKNEKRLVQQFTDKTSNQDLSFQKANHPNFQCKYCLSEFLSKRNLAEHMTSQHTQKLQWLQCDQCPYKVTETRLLKKHIHFHALDNKAFSLQCTMCSFRAKYKKKLTAHKLKKHSIIVENIEHHKCKFCSYRDILKRKVVRHTREKHSTGSADLLQCAHCPYQSKDKYRLEQHILVKHTALEKIDWFKCEYCKFRSKTKLNFKYHMEKHEGKTIRCEHCPYTTYTPRILKQHTKLKHNKDFQWYKCAHCALKTRYKDTLILHLRAKHMGKIYKCNLCDFQSGYIRALKRHRIAKHDFDAESFTCEHCSYKTHFTSQLRSHQKIKHKYVEDAELVKCTEC